MPASIPRARRSAARRLAFAAAPVAALALLAAAPAADAKRPVRQPLESTTTTTAAPTTTTAAPTTTTAAPTTTTTAAPTTTTAAPTTTTSAAPTTADAPATSPVPSGRYGTRIEEGFDSTGWWQAWGLARNPANTGIVVDDTDEPMLGIRIAAGSHDGTSFLLPTGAADEVHLQYRLRLPLNWDASAAQGNVKLPGFGNPRRDSSGACLAGCGGEPADGITSYSARSDVNSSSNQPGWYVYHAGMSQVSPSYGWGLRWPGAAPLEAGRWYTIDLVIRMNTPGGHDGVLQAWIDGVQVFDGPSFNFRLVPTLHVGGAWFDVYYGGTGVAPQTMILAIDDIVVEY